MPSGWTSQLGVKRTPEEQKKWNKRANRLLIAYAILGLGSILLCLVLS